MNRLLFVVPAYVGFMLISVNLLGVDPADVILLAIAGVLLILNPVTYTFPQVSLMGKLGVSGFLLCYAMSCLSGFRSSFVVYVLSGLAIAVVMSFYLRRDPSFRLGIALFFGFIFTNLAAIALWWVGVWPSSVFFDLFRDGRYLGAMGDPNFSGLMAAFTLFFLVDRLLRPQSSRGAIVVNAVAVSIVLAMLLFSQSRAAWGAALGGLAMQLVASRQLFTIRTTVALFGLAAVVMGIATSNVSGISQDVGSVTDRVTTVFAQNDAAEEERFKFYYTRVSLEVGLEHPLGVGPGMTFTYTGLVNSDGGPIGAHNAYVEILTENGWFALAIITSLLTAAWFRVFRLAMVDAFLGDISCRTIIAGLTATALFGMGHDLLGWRIGWIFPILAILAAFNVDFESFRPLWTSNAGSRR